MREIAYSEQFGTEPNRILLTFVPLKVEIDEPRLLVSALNLEFDINFLWGFYGCIFAKILAIVKALLILLQSYFALTSHLP